MSPTTAAPTRRRPSGPAAPSAPPPRRRPAPPVRRGAAPPRTRPRPPTRRVVPPPAPRKRRPGLRVAALVVAVASIVITIAGFHAFLAQNQVRLEDLRARTDRAEARYESLRLENGRLTSPARITARAGELGLGPPTEPPVAIPLTGDVPKRGGSSETLSDWAEVKHHLDASP